MQPTQPHDDNWQQPPQQPGQAPYAVAQDTSPQPQSGPVVTMKPEGASDLSVAPLPSPTQSPSEPASPNTPSAPPAQEIEPVHWQATEYIHREKNALWFVVFALVVIGLMAAAIFLMDSLSFAILIPVMAAALLVYTHRPPRLLDYTLSQQGLHVNDHLYSFAEFKGFGVIHDGEEYSVLLIPVKRFRPGVSVYFPEEAGEAIVDMLGARLPMQELHLDLVDRLIRALRI